jgi:hypothetical protein
MKPVPLTSLAYPAGGEFGDILWYHWFLRSAGDTGTTVTPICSLKEQTHILATKRAWSLAELKFSITLFYPSPFRRGFGALVDGFVGDAGSYKPVGVFI